MPTKMVNMAVTEPTQLATQVNALVHSFPTLGTPITMERIRDHNRVMQGVPPCDLVALNLGGGLQICLTWGNFTSSMQLLGSSSKCSHSGRRIEPPLCSCCRRLQHRRLRLCCRLPGNTPDSVEDWKANLPAVKGLQAACEGSL